MNTVKMDDKTVNHADNPKSNKVKEKGIMSVPQALSCLEVAMKWQTGFKKVFRINIIPSPLYDYSGNNCGFIHRS